MLQSQDKPRKNHVNPEQGLGYFPLSDMQFDIVNVIAEKSKALQAYDRYIRDCRPNPELLAVFESIKADDRRHIEQLKRFLGS